MIIYIDGSHGGKSNIVTWGVHALYEDQIIERVGSEKQQHSKFCLHEIFALFEGVGLAHEMGIAPKDVSFYTDDEVVGFGAPQLKGNFISTNYGDRLADSLEKMRSYYNGGAVDCVRNYLTSSRFIKVKGHRKTVGNLRADYLARRTLQLHRENKPREFMPFDKWINQPFTYYDRWGVIQQYTMPFTD